MHCIRQITKDLLWVGGNDRRLSMFEGVYSVPRGVSYNAYLLLDEKTVLFDTVDKSVGRVFFENLAHGLKGRPLDYVVVQHMEPDHSATLFELLLRYPDTVVVCNEKSAAMINQFFGPTSFAVKLVKEGEALETGRHSLQFFMAPMVHWPEVMVTYDRTDKTLFSADAFGTFGALNGALFADEVDFGRDYLDEARRYYANIVGKYGVQVQALLKKCANLDIAMICPLHGFVWRKKLGDYLAKYQAWSSYAPEEAGVVIAYASIYGNTENAAEILSCRLRELGVPTVMFDVSVTAASEIIAACFRFSHLVFASATYNAGVFVTMDELLRDLASHNIQNRTVALLQNGSWGPTSGKLMGEILAPCKNLTFLEQEITIKSALREEQAGEIDALAAAIRASMPLPPAAPQNQGQAPAGTLDPNAMFKLTYGLFVLTAREGDKDNGCIINTVQQLTDTPYRISIAVNKKNYTHDMILKTGRFNVSVLTEEAPFSLFQHFGFQSGRDVDKFADFPVQKRSENGIYYLSQAANGLLSGQVVDHYDYGTHTLFIAEVTESQVLSGQPSLTYAYYFAHVKPKPQVKKEATGKVWVCKICGFIYDEAVEGTPFESLPADWVCPLCKHPKSDFELEG